VCVEQSDFERSIEKQGETAKALPLTKVDDASIDSFFRAHLPNKDRDTWNRLRKEHPNISAFELIIESIRIRRLADITREHDLGGLLFPLKGNPTEDGGSKKYAEVLDFLGFDNAIQDVSPKVVIDFSNCSTSLKNQLEKLCVALADITSAEVMLNGNSISFGGALHELEAINPTALTGNLKQRGMTTEIGRAG